MKFFKSWTEIKNDFRVMTRRQQVIAASFIIVPWAVTIFCLFSLNGGCTSTNPAYTPIAPGQPNTNTVPQYIVNPAINTYSNAVSGVAGVVAPLNPYSGLTSWAITAIFGVLGGISTYVAKQKSGAVNSMASAVVQAGAHAAVLDAAGNTPHFTAIADAINTNLGSNQSLNQSATPPKV